MIEFLCEHLFYTRDETLITTYEQLEQKTYENNIILIKTYLPRGIKGNYFANTDYQINTITLSKRLKTTHEKCTVLAEELGHHYTTHKDLFSVSKTIQDKYERRACEWAVNELVSLNRLIDAWIDGVRTPWDLAEYLDVTEPFLYSALKIHSEKYGPSTKYKKYKISFNLLNIEEVS